MGTASGTLRRNMISIAAAAAVGAGTLLAAGRGPLDADDDADDAAVHESEGANYSPDPEDDPYYPYS